MCSCVQGASQQRHRTLEHYVSARRINRVGESRASPFVLRRRSSGVPIVTMHLVVPLDGSELALSALPIARLLGLSTGAELTLISVVPGDAEPASTRGVADWLHEIAAAERAAGLVVHTKLRIGEPTTEILQLADECEPAVLIMATHGRSGIGRMLLGSAADQLLHASDMPVLLLHPNQHEISQLRTILVPVDGRPGGAVALGMAAPLARSTNAKLVLVRATVPLPVWLYDPTLGLDTGPLINPMWDEDAPRAAETYAEGLAGRLRRTGLDATGRGVSGQPGAAILSVADEVDADLIVMSTHARRGLARSVLGSVADEVVRESHRPVLLLRHAAGARQPNPARLSPSRTRSRGVGARLTGIKRR